MFKSQATALIVDDEKDIRDLIEMAFMGMDIECILAPTLGAAIRSLKKNQQIDFCITDMRLPDGDGLNLVSHIQKHYSHIPVCMITAHGNMDLAVKALKFGAFDFVSKPFDLNQLRNMATAAIKLSDKSTVTSDNKTATQENKATKAIKIIGDSPVMKKLAVIITKLARSQAPVFIHGESGTGKELVAQNIHAQSARRDEPFVPVNCGAIPENLLESEFFGYVKGAFTGADKDQDGLFVAANGGTLFLDEVADLPLAMQVKLLRAIQEQAIKPIGGNEELAINVRILSATHKNLPELVKLQLFREDLYYRLNVISLGLPPLRKRVGDVGVLAGFILQKLATRQQIEAFTLTDEALTKLQSHDFPGNVRELENILERATTFCEESTITATDIQLSDPLIAEDIEELSSLSVDLSKDFDDPKEYQATALSAAERASESDNAKSDNTINNLSVYMENVERNALADALAASDGNKSLTAKRLGLNPRTLRHKLQKYGLN